MVDPLDDKLIFVRPGKERIWKSPDQEVFMVNKQEQPEKSIPYNHAKHAMAKVRNTYAHIMIRTNNFVVDHQQNIEFLIKEKYEEFITPTQDRHRVWQSLPIGHKNRFSLELENDTQLAYSESVVARHARCRAELSFDIISFGKQPYVQHADYELMWVTPTND